MAATPVRLVQISDIHCGEITFDTKLMESTVARINDLHPDLVVVAGDLTAAGYEWEYAEAADWIGQIEHAKIVIPGNHDARNVGAMHFEHYFGDRFSSVRVPFDEERGGFIDATGFTVVAVDSSEPDLNEGQIGRERYPWIAERFTEPDDIKVFAIHHHLVAIPGTGRERNTINDAGDLLARLVELDVDIVLSGHKHVPYFWGLNGILVCNSGTASTKRLRGRTPPSWNEIEVDSSRIHVYTHYADGTRELSCERSRHTVDMVRDSFSITADFIERNHLRRSYGTA